MICPGRPGTTTTSRLISEGGGVYPRQAKSIPVSTQVRSALGLPEDTTQLSPPELLRAILLAPADLLYNGGIGTYVKASTETHAMVGDKANDAIRVDGRDLRVKVVGEGGNLGMTQRGRIEAALQGVILNTDAIDNSAGVDCSDHEVNIKIFVDRMVAAGKLDAAERSEFLASMTDEVGRLVLEDNIDQNILLLNDRQKVAEWSPSYERLMDWLEKIGGPEPGPGGAAVPPRPARTAGAGAGPHLTGTVRAGRLRQDRTGDGPARQRPGRRPVVPRDARGSTSRTSFGRRFDAELDTHPLRREIIATVVANDMINLGGITFAFRTMEETSASEVAVAKAFVALREIYELDVMVAELNDLPASFPTEHWSTVHLDVRRLLDRAVRWVLAQGSASRPIADIVAEFKPPMDPCAPGCWTTCAVTTASAWPPGLRRRGRGAARGPGATAGQSCSRASSCWTSQRSRTAARSRWRTSPTSTTRYSTASTWTPCWSGSVPCPGGPLAGAGPCSPAR